jgi:hypothetical protein
MQMRLSTSKDADVCNADVCNVEACISVFTTRLQ